MTVDRWMDIRIKRKKGEVNAPKWLWGWQAVKTLKKEAL